MIQPENITKQLGSAQAVDEISFEVHQCEIFRLLGPKVAAKPLRWIACKDCASRIRAA